MCGVAGFAIVTGTEYPAAAFKSFLNQSALAISHRGPDAGGVWVNPNGRVGFVHRRLSILDLSERGSQPMLDEWGNALTFNGEIYNFQDLRNRFNPHDFKSESDTEVLIKGLAQYGLEWVCELDAMFAFGFYSHRQQKLLLAVDPAGKKPLYTYWDGKIFAFASEIKALQAFPGLDFSLNREHLKESLIFGYVPWPNTVYKFISKLPAGHHQTILLNHGPQAPVQYWDIPLGKTARPPSIRKAQIQLQSLLSAAVKKRLVADVPVGCFLSGGVDSSAIAVEAAKILPLGTLQTFAAGFARDQMSSIYDESRFAQRVAQQIGSKHRLLEVVANGVNAANIMRRFDEPFGDSSAIPTYLLCQETAQHLKVVLSGDGGDELFGGYLRFSAGLLSEKYQTLWQVLLSPLTLFNAAPHSLMAKLQRFRLAVSLPLIKRLAVWNSFFSESELTAYFGESTQKLRESTRQWDEKTHGLPIGEKILYYNFKTYLFDDLLTKMDRMSMAHGLEVRSPFLDKALIEFAFSLPTEYKFGPFQTKKILKDVYRPILGSEITDRSKHGFAFPLETFLDGRSLEDEAAQMLSWFPLAKFNGRNLVPGNRFSKQFMLYCVNQYLSNMNIGSAYAV